VERIVCESIRSDLQRVLPIGTSFLVIPSYSVSRREIIHKSGLSDSPSCQNVSFFRGIKLIFSRLQKKHS